MLTHRFLCPASRLDQLQAELVETDHVRLGLITDQGTDGLVAVLEIIETDPRLSLALLELPVAAFGEGGDQLSTALQVLEHVPTAVSAYYEPAAPELIDELAGALVTCGTDRPLGAKLRCGGVRAELFPTAAHVAHFLIACEQAKLPMKATAGLHQAVRHRDPATGFVHHGYCNLLLAAARAVAGSEQQAVDDALTCTDPAELAERLGRLDRQAATQARALLHSYGSCSTSTPISQAQAMLQPTKTEAS